MVEAVGGCVFYRELQYHYSKPNRDAQIFLERERGFQGRRHALFHSNISVSCSFSTYQIPKVLSLPSLHSLSLHLIYLYIHIYMWVQCIQQFRLFILRFDLYRFMCSFISLSSFFLVVTLCDFFCANV